MLLLCQITIIILHNAIRFIHIDLNPTPSIVNSMEGIVVYNNLHDMAVRLKYADLTYVKQPDARPLDLTSFREAGAAITAAADNPQERAIRNENAYNEMAIKMSEYNAIQGVDEEALAGKINETQEHIKAKVDEDGGWFFADTAVSDGARKFLTDDDVKTILTNKANYDSLMSSIDKSDMSAEYKSLYKDRIISAFRNAGGSLGGNGRQSILSFGSAPNEKGFDRKIYQDRMLEYFKAMKADKNFFYSDTFKQQAIDILNNPTLDPNIRSTINALQNATMHGYQEVSKTVESIGRDRLMEVARVIVGNDPQFKENLAVEASLNLYAANKQGLTPGDVLKQINLANTVSNPNYVKQLVLNSSEYKNATPETKRLMLAQITNPNSEFVKAILEDTFDYLNQNPNESAEEYDTRMTQMYINNYISDNIQSVAKYIMPMAYTQVEGKTNTKWFESLFTNQLNANKDKSDKILKARDRIVSNMIQFPSQEENMIEYTNELLSTKTKSLNLSKTNLDRFESELNDRAKNGYEITQDDKNKLQRLKDEILDLEGDINDIIYSNDDYAGLIPDNRKAFTNQVKSGLFNVIDFNKIDTVEMLNDPIFDTIDEKSRNTIAYTFDKEHGIKGLEVESISKIISNSKTQDDAAKAFLNYLDDHKTNPFIYAIKKNLKNIYGDLEYGVKSFISQQLSKFSNKTPEESLTNPGRVIGSSDAKDNSIVGDKRKDLLYSLRNRPENFVVYRNILLDGDDIEIDPDALGIPIDLNNENLRNIFYQEKDGTDKNPKYIDSDLICESVVLENGTVATNIIKPIQGRTDVKQCITLIAKTLDEQKLIDDLAFAYRATAYQNRLENPNSDTNSIFDYMSKVHGSSLHIGPDPSDIEQMNNADLYDSYTYHGKTFNTLGSLLKEYTRRPDNNSHTINIGNLKITFNKDKNNDFHSNIQAYDTNTKSWIDLGSFVYDNSEDLKNAIQRDASEGTSRQDYLRAYYNN